MAKAAKRERARTLHERSHEDWHTMLDELTMAYNGEDATIELLDREFGDEYEAERMPLSYVEYDEHADMFSVAVGGRDGRYPVVLRHGVEHPSAILTDTQAPTVPLAVEAVGADGSRTLVTVYTRTAAAVAGAGADGGGPPVEGT